MFWQNNCLVLTWRWLDSLQYRFVYVEDDNDYEEVKDKDDNGGDDDSGYQDQYLGSGLWGRRPLHLPWPGDLPGNNQTDISSSWW